MNPVSIFIRAVLGLFGITIIGVCPPAAAAVAAGGAFVAVHDSRRYGQRPGNIRPARVRGVASQRRKPVAAR
jgi:hypothetical protein